MESHTGGSQVMTSLSARRILPTCLVVAAALVALAAPGTASAASDLGQQCSGASIEGLGSTFQNPAQKVWNPGFNSGANAAACSGTQGSKGTPAVAYSQTEANKGSGACLKDYGAEAATPKYAEFPFCGTDEAPNEKQKGEIEQNATGAAAKSLETIPVLQGSLAVIVHLPEGCVAQSEVASGTKKIKLGRLVFDNLTVEGIYRGTI